MIPGMLSEIPQVLQDLLALPVPGHGLFLLKKREVDNILKQTKTEVSKYKELFTKNEPVKVISGPFADFTGIVEEVYPERAKLKVLITIFGRETPVEIEYGQVEKI